MGVSWYGIVQFMSQGMVGLLCRAGGCLLAMILIWRLVETAISAGIDGVVFFTGVAAIAGLGGYSVRWLVDFVKAKSTEGGRSTKNSDQE